jgi:hypothetical protein
MVGMTPVCMTRTAQHGHMAEPQDAYEYRSCQPKLRSLVIVPRMWTAGSAAPVRVHAALPTMQQLWRFHAAASQRQRRVSATAVSQPHCTYTALPRSYTKPPVRLPRSCANGSCDTATTQLHLTKCSNNEVTV